MAKMLLCCYLSIASANPCAKLQQQMNPPISTGKISWLGADSAASIQINPNYRVWLFADTLLGTTSHYARFLKAMLHNSVGVQVKNKKGWGVIKKYWHKNSEHPQPIFKDDNNAFYWPLSGIMLQHKLLVTAVKVDASGSMKPIVIVVQNPSQLPTKWHYKVFPILLSAGVAQKRQWLYFFGPDKNMQHTVLARISQKDALNNQWQKMQLYFKNTNLPAFSEISIVHRTKWLIYQIPYLDKHVYRYTTTNFHTPWKNTGAVYTFKSQSINKQRLRFYAVKVHSNLLPNHRITLTYNTGYEDWANTNLKLLAATLENPKNKYFYVPRFLCMH